MEFFFYFVFWPLVAGAGTIYLSLLHAELFKYFLLVWPLVWLVWPIGTYRRRFMRRILDSFEEEAKLNEQALTTLPLLGIPFVMLLALWAGLQITPVLLEHAGVNVTARLEEIQQDAERRERSGDQRGEHPESPELPSQGSPESG